MNLSMKTNKSILKPADIEKKDNICYFQILHYGESYVSFSLIFPHFPLYLYNLCNWEKKVEADLSSSFPNILPLPGFPIAISGYNSYLNPSSALTWSS